MTEIHVEGVDRTDALLSRFQRASVLTETVDTVTPTLVTAMRMAAPKDTGALAESIRSMRHTSLGAGGAVDLLVTAHKPYAGFVLHGTKPHDITPRNKQALSWMAPSGDQTFATIVHHPGTKPNPFPRRVWLGLRESILNEMVAQVRRKLYE